MNFQLITLSGVKHDAELQSVQLPTAAGEITVMSNHEPLMSVITPGVITVKPVSGAVEHYATFGGVVEVRRAGVKVLVDEADHGDEINEQEAERAREAAQRLLKDAKNQVELNQAQAMIDRQAVRLQVAQLRRRHSRR
jgi:F-type H+-transporting ATPase subunit epsilon